MLLSLLAAFAHAAVVKPVGWTASSTANPGEGVSYEPTNLSDAKQGNFWANADKSSGLGQWVMADFGGEKTITGLTIWPGCWYTFDYWKRYTRPKTVVLEFSDGSTQEMTLEDAFKPQTLKLNSPKKTTSVKVKIKGVYDGTTWNEAAISEILFVDGNRDDAPKATISASTIFPADGDGNYDTVNLQDGISDSMWCEGSKSGDGTNEWLEFRYASPQPVSKLILRNGNASSFKLYMASNRATTATLAFGDGSTETVTIKDTLTEQTITFPSRTTDKVRVTFTTVKKGSEYNDMCVSEASFAP